MSLTFQVSFMRNLFKVKVMATIINELQSAKYFSISVDSTPDIKHVDQLCFTVRYVLTTGPVERFLCLISMSGHKGTDIAEIIFILLEEHGIDISNCRGQSYDNASNMSGKYNGVQKLIKDVCPYAEYCPCCGHSLNLIGVCMVDNCPASFSLSCLIQKVYVFYAASTQRWQKQCDILEKKDGHLHLVVKRLAETRWSASADAVKALFSAYEEHIALLTEFSNDREESKERQRDASGILKKLKKLDTIQKTSEALQKKGLALNTAVDLLKSLVSFIGDMRERYDGDGEKGDGALSCIMPTTKSKEAF